MGAPERGTRDYTPSRVGPSGRPAASTTSGSGPGSWESSVRPVVPQDLMVAQSRPTPSGARPYDASDLDARDHMVAPRSDSGPIYRPDPGYVRNHPDGGPAPRHSSYRGYYGGYYCHPWYRYQYYTTATVWFGFGVYPWTPGWIPPARYGWGWVPGYWYFGWWHPGYWRPTVVVPVGYVFVPGWWQTETIYVEGYYRKAERSNWRWVDGHYLDDGTFVRGHWVPVGDHPEGYTWVPGFWDGERWMEGFWRPEYRKGFRWLDGFYDENGLFQAGYWVPVGTRPGMVWVPGWFDGTAWVEGYWIDEAEVEASDPESWEPEIPEADAPIELDDGAPLAMPVPIEPGE